MKKKKYASLKSRPERQVYIDFSDDATSCPYTSLHTLYAYSRQAPALAINNTTSRTDHVISIQFQ